MTVRVLVADDQDLVRTGLSMILDAQPDIEVVAQAADGHAAVELARRLRPDVCLVDVRMPGLDGIEVTELLAGKGVPDPVAVVVITTFDLDEYVHGALRAGARGFLLKDAGPELLVQAVHAAAETLRENSFDIPFALVYLVDGETANLAERISVDADSPAAPTAVSPGKENDLWKFAAAAKTGRQMVKISRNKFGTLTAGAWEDDTAKNALVLPLWGTGEAPAGFLVCGLSPRLSFDDEYAGFIDLIAGQIDMMIDPAANALPQVSAGSVKAYAVTAATRLATAPTIPTADEAGISGLHISNWAALFAPKGTPNAFVARLNAAVVEALADSAVRARLAGLGYEIVAREQQSPEALAAHHKAEIEKWWPIIKAAGMRAE